VSIYNIEVVWVNHFLIPFLRILIRVVVLSSLNSSLLPLVHFHFSIQLHWVKNWYSKFLVYDWGFILCFTYSMHKLIVLFNLRIRDILDLLSFSFSFV
jgi:hypothetical protein